MSQPNQALLHNKLLRRLSPAAFSLLQPSLLPIALPRGQSIAEPGIPCEWAVFPESGLMSIVTRAPDRRELEIGIFGRDGMGSTALALGVETTPYRIYAQMAGEGFRMPATALMQAVAATPEIAALLLLYVQAFMIQVAQTALANACYTIEQRLARWLLMAHDLADEDDLALTHEFLSIMLGVRRTGVTLALHRLEGERMIRARRGVVRILDRKQLENTAAGSYGSAEAEYDRLFSPEGQPAPDAAPDAAPRRSAAPPRRLIGA